MCPVQSIPRAASQSGLHILIMKEATVDNQKTYSTKVGVFETTTAANKAVADLQGLGYRADQIGLVVKDESGKAVRTAPTAAGGFAGVGIAPGVVPLLGPVLTMGTVCSATLTADGGSARASLSREIIDWSVPEEDAAFYEREVQAGRCLVTVNCGDRADVSVVFARHGGYERTTSRVD